MFILSTGHLDINNADNILKLHVAVQLWSLFTFYNIHIKNPETFGLETSELYTHVHLCPLRMHISNIANILSVLHFVDRFVYSSY